MKKNKWSGYWTLFIITCMGLSGCGFLGKSVLKEQRLPETKPQEITQQETATENPNVQTFNRVPDRRIELPAQFDTRELGRAPEVKDQGDLGTCWAFASLMALQSTLQPGEVWDFSEDHMSSNKNFTLSQKEGGEYTMSMAYLLSWQGPVLETEDPYGDGISPDGLGSVKHVQEIQLLPERDLESIKQGVYQTGGVQSSLYTNLQNKDSQSIYYNRETDAYYYNGDKRPNHDVVIVGWDDDFPKTSFWTEAPGDGAFLCANSWGTQFGNEGYFYVSYYDTNIANTNILYSLVEPVDNYDRIYQSDLCGWIGQIGYGNDTAWAVNVYAANQEERLKAVGFYATEKDTEFEIYVVKHVSLDEEKDMFKNRKKVAQGTLAYGGFYTVPIEESIELSKGERYGVMIKLTTPKVVHPIAIEYDPGDGKSKIDITDGEGYISKDGEHWQNVEEAQNCNLCIKAYTTNP